ncbi:IS66 family insertion sequence element accessory protein TnpA [Bacteroides faecis]|uniref:IS66 family insertion sequence element accessory protein TnpA n=1 Tax=Bacteroides faecis TaxID=674529 RepID=UPI003DA6B50F
MKNLTLDEFKKIHEDWKSTGLSIRDYCGNTGFEESKFYYWRKKLTESLLPQSKGFVPVQMNRQNGKILTSSLKFEWFYNWFIIRKLQLCVT